MKASIAIQVPPVASNQDETLRIIDEAIAYIKISGLHCHVGPFETTIEGESYDQLMDIVKGCQHVAVRAGAKSMSWRTSGCPPCLLPMILMKSYACQTASI